MSKFLKFAAIAGLAVSSAACGDIFGSGGDGETSLSFTSQSQSSVLFGRQASVVADSILVGGHAIVLTSVDFGLTKVELEGDSVELEMKGRSTFSVPLNGAVVTPFSVTAPAGVYDELEFKVESARLRGTFDGQPFDATIRVVTKIEQDINPVLVVGSDGKANVTVTLNTANWFRSNQGIAIDPRSLDAASSAQLMSNIKASFKAFDDDNRNGRNDSGDDDDDDDRR